MGRSSIPPSAFRHRGSGDSSTFYELENTSVSQEECLNSRTYYSRRCKKKNPLPDELLFDILVGFPADFLYDKARLVCRRWSRIIHSQDFIAKQIHHSTTYGLLLSPSSLLRCHPIYVSFTHAKDLHLINPTTKQPFLLPSVNQRKGATVCPHFCGIAYSAASMEFKLTVPFEIMCLLPRTQGLDILTVGVDNSWRNVEVSHLPPHVFRALLTQPPLTTEGFLHWSGEARMLTLNVETETFTWSQLPLPSQGLYYYLSTGRSLSSLRDCQDYWWEVWETKPESGECRKMMSFHLNLTKLLKCEGLEQLAYLKPLGWVKYPEVLAFSYRDLTCIFYEVDKHEICTIKLPAPCRGLAHRNNLVWLS